MTFTYDIFDVDYQSFDTDDLSTCVQEIYADCMKLPVTAADILKTRPSQIAPSAIIIYDLSHLIMIFKVRRNIFKLLIPT